MARKKLLTEGEIRQFMKLASLRPINKVRLSEYSGMPGDREMEDDSADDVATLDADDAMADEDDAMGDAEVMLSDEDAAAIAAAAPAMQKVADAVVGGDEMADMAMDDEMAADIDMADDMTDDMDDEVDPMMEMESDAAAMRAKRDKRAKAAPGRAPFGKPDPAKPDSMAHGAGAGKDEEPLRNRNAVRPSSRRESVDHDAIVNEVVSRVHARMQAQQEASTQKDALADQLAERIMKRLTK